MKRPLQIMIMVTLLTGLTLSAHAQNNPRRTASARAAYGNATSKFKANTRKNKKVKQRARKTAKQRKPRDNRESYWRSRPY